MTLFQVGFLANEPLGGSEPNNSHELASAQPVPVSGPVQLSKPCAGGWGFALAIAAGADQVFSWGVNSATILAKAGGNEDGADPATLDEVASGVTAAAAGFDHGLLVVDGKVLAFGPAFRPAGTAPGLYLMPMAFKVAVAQVAAGEHHSLALAVSGDVFAWGSNAEGQLGNGTTTASDAPLLVAGPSLGPSDSELLQPLTSVACGARHSLAINAQGQCLAWGWSLHGQCGTGKAAPSVATPAVVQGLGPLKCTAVAGGMAHSLVCTDQGDVYAWGLNGDGQLGDGSDVSALKPQLLEDAALASESVVKVAAGSRHSLLLCASGKAYACGWGSFGQLGTGRFASSRTPAAVAVPAGAKVVDVAAGWWHSLIVTE